MTTSFVNATENREDREPGALSPRAYLWLRFATLLAILEATTVGRLLNHIAPSFYDSQVFAYIGMSWADGRIPYVSLWDFKPPGIFAISAAAFEFLPRTTITLSVIEGIWLLATIAVIFALCRKLGMPEIVQYATSVCAAIAINLSYYNEGGNITEIYLLLPAVASIYLFVSAAPRFLWQWMLLAGLCTGVATLFKPVGLAPFLAEAAFLLYLSVIAHRIAPFAALRAILCNFGGVVLPWLAAAAYFARYGAAGDFADAALIFPTKYSAANQHHLLAEPFIVLHLLAPVAVLLMAAMLGFFLFWKELRTKPQANASLAYASPLAFWPLIFLWMGADLAGAVTGGKNYEHYFLPLVLSLSVAAGFFLWQMYLTMPTHRTLFTGLVALLLIGSLALAQARDAGQKLRGRSDRRPSEQQWAQIAGKIKSAEHPGDTLYVWPYEPGIYFATALPAASRRFIACQIYDHPSAYVRFGNEMLRDLRAQPPTFVVDCTVPCVRGRGPASRQEVPAMVRNGDPVYESFRTMVDDDYEEIFRTADFRAFRRKATSR